MTGFRPADEPHRGVPACPGGRPGQCRRHDQRHRDLAHGLGVQELSRPRPQPRHRLHHLHHHLAPPQGLHSHPPQLAPLQYRPGGPREEAGQLGGRSDQRP